MFIYIYVYVCVCVCCIEAIHTLMHAYEYTVLDLNPTFILTRLSPVPTVTVCPRGSMYVYQTIAPTTTSQHTQCICIHVHCTCCILYTCICIHNCCPYNNQLIMQLCIHMHVYNIQHVQCTCIHIHCVCWLVVVGAIV